MSDIRIGIIGGSGLGGLLAETADARRHEIDTPFGQPSDAILETEWEGLSVFLLSRHGAGHLLNPSQVPFRANLFALKKLGVTHVIATGAVGSLRQEIRHRDLVIVDQIIDKTHRRDGTFFENAAVHVEFAEPFCPVLRKILIDSAPPPAAAGDNAAAPFTVHERGCYVCMEGPAFSTRAESLMHRLWGGDVIGMTAMPEAKLAREAELPYALVALSTDYDCWKSKPAGSEPAKDAAPAPAPEALLAEIIGNLQTASGNAMALIRRALQKIAADPAPLAACPASEALKLAIWSDKSRINRAEVDKLAPLWGKYFA